MLLLSSVAIVQGAPGTHTPQAGVKYTPSDPPRAGKLRKTMADTFKLAPGCQAIFGASC